MDDHFGHSIDFVKGLTEATLGEGRVLITSQNTRLAERFSGSVDEYIDYQYVT
jgi:hypothetical protein